jgi:hypothetical protein
MFLFYPMYYLPDMRSLALSTNRYDRIYSTNVSSFLMAGIWMS